MRPPLGGMCSRVRVSILPGETPSQSNRKSEIGPEPSDRIPDFRLPSPGCESGSGKDESAHGGCLGAQISGREGDERPALHAGGLALRRGPPAFRAHEQGDGLRGKLGRKDFSFRVEKQPVRTGPLQQRPLERKGSLDSGPAGRFALLRRLARNAIEPLPGCRGPAERLSPGARDERHALGEKLRRLLGQPGKTFDSETRHEERDRGNRITRGQDPLDRDVAAAAVETRQESLRLPAASVEKNDRVSGAQSSSARMRGLLGRESRGFSGARQRRHYETRSRQTHAHSLSVRRMERSQRRERRRATTRSSRSSGIPERTSRPPGATRLITAPRTGRNSSGSRFARTSGKTRAMASTAAADRKSTRLNSSHITISYAVFCLK